MIRASRLSLVAPVERPARLEAIDRRFSLDDGPWRPGEMPQSVPLCLGDDVRQVARVAAAQAGVSVQLYARVAVEAVRSSRMVAAAAGDDIARVVTACADAAAAGGDQRPAQVTTYGRDLVRYAQQLRRRTSRPVPARSAGPTIEVMVPEEMAAAWQAAAMRDRQALDVWAACALLDAPVGVTAWEASAAAGAMTLAEWVYIEALKRVASSNDAAQART